MASFFLILFACLSIMSFYFKFIKKEDYHGQGTTAVVFLPLITFAMAFVVYSELTATNELAKYITPYNGNMSSKYMPIEHMWSFESTDAKEVVEAFHLDESNYEGWELIRGFPFMMLQKGNVKMNITVNVNFMKKTNIDYTLSNVKKSHSVEDNKEQ